MRNLRNIILIGISTLLVMSCSTFESDPLDLNTEEVVVNPKDSTASGMKALFYAIYSDLPNLHTRFQDSYLDASTDDGVPTKDKGGKGSLENYRNGGLSSDNIASLDGNFWKASYSGIRKANLFLQKIEGYPSSTLLPAFQIVEMKAEARALRAYYYMELVKRWQGVPLIGDQVLQLDSDINIPKSTMKECLDYIYSEISPDSTNSCFADLTPAISSVVPENTVYYGRFNKGVILGLLSRMQLYLASPLYAEIPEMGGSSTAKWQAAADAALEVINLNVYGLAPDFLKMFADKNSFPSKEIIMVKEMGSNNSIELSNSPAGYFTGTVKCKGLTSPSQNLVDAFLTKSGQRIDEPGSGYDPQNPYANRDPRLGYTVFFNGARWLKRPVETFEGGKDREYRPGLFYTQTGYYLRKFLSLSEESSTFPSVAHHVQMIRYAEILLNYVEALNEIDTDANKATIEKHIMAIRQRAGIDKGTGRYGLPATYTQAEMREIIRNERRIELAFEDHRFWDIRRWKIAEQVMNKPVRGVTITKLEDNTFKYDYNVVARQSMFSPKMYWYPIPLDELQGNSQLKQNPGWDY